MEVCPHLTRSEVQALMHRMAKGQEVMLATPPLLVDGAYHLFIAGPRKQAAKNLFSKLIFHSTAEHVKNDRMRKGIRSGFHSAHEFSARAVEFARKHWGERLMKDNWVDICAFRLIDPLKQVDGDYPLPELSVFAVTSQGMYSICNDHSAPPHELVDDAIVFATTSSLEYDELQAKLWQTSSPTSFWDNHYICVRCGDGLQVTKCPTCELKIRLEEARSSSRMPLPVTLEQILVAKGHTFITDVEQARGRYNAELAKTAQRVAEQANKVTL